MSAISSQPQCNKAKKITQTQEMTGHGVEFVIGSFTIVD